MRRLLSPATFILVAANLAPLAGVLFWGWDAFVLLMLYWLETAVIAFWTIVRVATLPRSALADFRFGGVGNQPAAPVGLAAFFTLHAGIFMGVHFFFLWELFAGAWRKKIDGVASFVDVMVVGTGLWLPLLVLFVARGALMMFESVKPRLMSAFSLAPRPEEQAVPVLSPGEAIIFGLYVRIFVMQFTIILGTWFALFLGSPGAYAFMVAVKTAIDVALQVAGDMIIAAWRKSKAEAEAAADKQG